jgi:hypothetical protein
LSRAEDVCALNRPKKAGRTTSPNAQCVHQRIVERDRRTHDAHHQHLFLDAGLAQHQRLIRRDPCRHWRNADRGGARCTGSCQPRPPREVWHHDRHVLPGAHVEIGRPAIGAAQHRPVLRRQSRLVADCPALLGVVAACEDIGRE